MFKSRLFRVLTLELIAISISLLVIAFAAGVAASIAGFIHDLRHAIPDPVERGDDFGAGLIMVVAALGSLSISLPATLIIHIFIFNERN